VLYARALPGGSLASVRDGRRVSGEPPAPIPSLGPFIGFGNGTLLFFTFAAVGVTFNLVLDMIMRRVVSPEVEPLRNFLQFRAAR
jgi:hypothetical protein